VNRENIGHFSDTTVAFKEIQKNAANCTGFIGGSTSTTAPDPCRAPKPNVKMALGCLANNTLQRISVCSRGRCSRMAKPKWMSTPQWPVGLLGELVKRALW
jgi:hypothetical protein